MKKCPHCKKSLETNRTPAQNNALHVFFDYLAKTLNESGLDQRVVLKPTYNMDWSPRDVKEHLWRPIQKALVKKESTTELDKHEEITLIHKTLMRELGEKFGLEYIPFPDVHQIGGVCGKPGCPQCNVYK